MSLIPSWKGKILLYYCLSKNKEKGNSEYRLMFLVDLFINLI